MTATLPVPASARATTYRTCPRSGLQFEASAERLMIANAVVAVVALLVGGLLAVGVVLTRWPAIHWLEADTFYMVLTAHGIDMLIFWIIFFEVAVLYFASSTLLRCRLATPKIAWLAFALMLIGAITNNVAVFQGGSSVMMTCAAIGLLVRVSYEVARAENAALHAVPVAPVVAEVRR